LQDFGVRPDIELWPANPSQMALCKAVPQKQQWHQLAGFAAKFASLPAATELVIDANQPQDDPAVQAAIRAFEIAAPRSLAKAQNGI
jgi:hypothetical protein